ncbi:MAG: transposase [Candidatus Omnitrophica bacterium]|nr:transposase [Candidatus Omnitrophota bacterium]
MHRFQSAEDGTLSRLLLIKDKIIFEDGIYHITQRAPGREVLFLENSDYLHFLSLLKETTSAFRLNIFSFVLMPNHVHILLQIKENNLPQAMKQVFQRYALYFNKKYERKGHVFCGVYRAALVNSEPYLLAASLYIHLNPFKAGLCKDAKDYQWSSVSLYTEGNGRSFINSRFILEFLDEDMDKSRDIYRKFLVRSSRLKQESILEEPKALAYFRDRLLKIIPKTISKLKNGQSRFGPLSDLEKKIEFFKRHKKKLRKSKDIAAIKYIIEQLKSRDYKVVDIAKKLNMDRTTIYRICNSSVSNKSVAERLG